MTEEQIARALRELRCAYDPDELPDLTVAVSMRQDSIAIAIEALSKLMTVEQVRWERDIALDQLHEINKELGAGMDDIVELLNHRRNGNG